MDGTCALRLTRSYGAPPAEVWATLTEPEALARWLGPMAEALRTNVRSVEAEKLLEVDWAPPGEDLSVVRFELRANGSGTVLVLDHRRIEARRGMRALGTWEWHLGRLDALLGVVESR